MAIKPPNWCSHAIPTVRGWEDPATGELYKSGRFTQAQIDEWHGVKAPAPAPVEEVETDMPEEAEPDYTTMSKIQLERIGREHGVELDRREKKSTLIQRVRDIVRSK